VKLLEFQRPGVAFLVRNRHAILADPPGLGKTAQLIRTLQVLAEMGENPFPALVVCPNSLKLSTWSFGFSTWAPEITTQVIDGTATQRRKQLAADADCYIVNWEGLRAHSRLAGYGTIALSEKDKTPKELNEMGFRTVIADEAHKGSNAQTAQTRALWALLHTAEFRYLATGTPGNVEALWALLHGIEPTWFPAKTKYLDRWADTSINYFGGLDVHGLHLDHRDEYYRITNPLIRRIPKEAALPQLPAKLPDQIRHTPMLPKKKAYEQMRDHMIANVGELLVAPNPLSQLMRLNQLAAACAEIDDDYNVTLVNPSPKVDDLVDLLDEMGDEPLVVAAVSRHLIELASERLTKLNIPHGLVTGAQSSYERAQAVDHFQAGRHRVILLTFGAGAEGLTLTRASRLLCMQESYSSIQNQQMYDRIYRIGSEQHDSIQIIKQITPHTVEETKQLLLDTKAMRLEEIVRDQSTLLTLLGGTP
jgi:SNF2 family DNA or RNA helicase